MDEPVIMKTAPSLSLALLVFLTIIQGVYVQDWKVTLSSDRICAVTGSSVVMPCSFTHPPYLTVSKVYWIINATKGRPTTDISTTPQYKDRVQYSTDRERNCTMTLSDVRVTDTALYYARIETQIEKQKWLSQRYIHLTVQDLVVQTSGPAIEGKQVTLSCNSLCILRQNSKIVWRKDGKVLPDTHTSINELLLHNISIEDEGHYSCALQHKEDRASKPLKLNVMYPPKNTSVSVSPAGAILEGSSVTLTCSSDANPPVESYTWFKRRGIATSAVGSDQIHNITNITSGHSWLYYCEANNQHGGSKSTDVCLDVQYPPRNTSASVSPSGEIVEGSSVVLTCSSDANPPVENFIWYRQRESAILKTATQQVYSISKASSEHTGNYHCQVSNKHGHTKSTVIHLNVLSSGWQRVAWTAGGAVALLLILIVVLAVVMKKKKTTHWARDSGRNTQDVADNDYVNVNPVTSDPAPRMNLDDDVQYTIIQFKSSRGQEVPLYSTVQKPKPHKQQEEETEVEYAATSLDSLLPPIQG